MALLVMAREFNKLPWEIRAAPADEVQYWLNILGIEGEYHADAKGLEPEDAMYDEDDD